MSFYAHALRARQILLRTADQTYSKTYRQTQNQNKNTIFHVEFDEKVTKKGQVKKAFNSKAAKRQAACLLAKAVPARIMVKPCLVPVCPFDKEDDRKVYFLCCKKISALIGRC